MLTATFCAQVGAGATNTVKSTTGMIMPFLTAGAWPFCMSWAEAVSMLTATFCAQVGAGATNTVKSTTGMIMPGAPKEEQEARKSGDHQDNKAAKDLDHEMSKDPKRMEKMVSAFLREMHRCRVVWEERMA